MTNHWRCCSMIAALALLAASCKVLARQVSTLYREAWADGTTKREGKLEDGMQTGDWTYYHESGRRRARGRYANDHQVGPWTFFYENGVVEWSGAFDETGRRTGDWIFHYPDDTLRARGAFLDDFEDGPWEFYAASGALERRGAFDAGKLSGAWHYFHADGKPKAFGLCHRGQRVGIWQLWDEAGGQRMQDFGKKPGVTPRIERWPSGNLRLAGVLQDGKPAGRWQTWHEDGSDRSAFGFRNGQPHGHFVLQDPAGQVLLQASLQAGRVMGGAIAVAGGLSQPLAAGLLSAPAEAVWFDLQQLAQADVLRSLACLCSEPLVPLQAVPEAAVATAMPKAEPALVAELAATPDRIPAPVQPDLTVTQRQEIDGYVLNYLEGPSATRVSRKKYGPAGSDNRASGPGRRAELEGKPLPMEVFQSVDGGELDIRQYRGKKGVLVVILRGFVGEVCVYCVAQTEALAQSRERLESLGIEVVVVYPGPRENEESFEKAYALTFGKGAPPYRVFYDPDLEFVTKLGIAGELAYPSTLIVDKEGLVQYAFVGEHRADRPAAKKLIELIEGMKQ
jgi:antitoxin component YwqK of YwqJK toxin-antitoxin module/peroxiredoxin